jgi:dienelactone hydrolase
VLPYVQAQGAKRIGFIGFCWGAKIALNALSDAHVSAAGLMHPSQLTAEEFGAVQGPVIVMPAQNDPDMAPLMESLKSNAKAGDSEHHRFDEQQHGWTVRGDLTNAATARDVTKSLDLLKAFFKRVWA